MGFFDTNSLLSFFGGMVVGAAGYGAGIEYGMSPTMAGAVGGAAGGATSSAIGGGNVGTGALYGGVGGGVAGYMEAGAPAVSTQGPQEMVSAGGLGQMGWTPVAVGAVGALGGLASIPPAQVDIPTASAPTVPTPAPMVQATTPPPVGVPTSIVPSKVESAVLPIAERKEMSPGEIDYLNKLAGERSAEQNQQAVQVAERYPVASVPTQAQVTPEERFLGLGGGKGRLRAIY